MGKDVVKVALGAVVAQNGRGHPRLGGQVGFPGAQVASRSQGGVVHVVRIRPAVAVRVNGPASPGPGQELHRPHGAVVLPIAVQRPAVAVRDDAGACEAAVQAGPEDVTAGPSVGVHASTAGMTGLDLADGGQEPPGKAARGVVLAVRSAAAW